MRQINDLRPASNLDTARHASLSVTDLGMSILHSIALAARRAPLLVGLILINITLYIFK
jgi:hypothetical protein